MAPSVLLSVVPSLSRRSDKRHFCSEGRVSPPPAALQRGAHHELGLEDEESSQEVRKSNNRGLAGGGGQTADPHTTQSRNFTFFMFLLEFCFYRARSFRVFGVAPLIRLSRSSGSSENSETRNPRSSSWSSDPGENCRWCSVCKQKARLSASAPVRCFHRRKGGVLFQTGFCIVVLVFVLVFFRKRYSHRNTVFWCTVQKSACLQRVLGYGFCCGSVGGEGEGEVVLNTYMGELSTLLCRARTARVALLLFRTQRWLREFVPGGRPTP